MGKLITAEDIEKKERFKNIGTVNMNASEDPNVWGNFFTLHHKHEGLSVVSKGSYVGTFVKDTDKDYSNDSIILNYSAVLKGRDARNILWMLTQDGAPNLRGYQLKDYIDLSISFKIPDLVLALNKTYRITEGLEQCGAPGVSGTVSGATYKDYTFQSVVDSLDEFFSGAVDKEVLKKDSEMPRLELTYNFKDGLSVVGGNNSKYMGGWVGSAGSIQAKGQVMNIQWGQNILASPRMKTKIQDMLSS